MERRERYCIGQNMDAGIEGNGGKSVEKKLRTGETDGRMLCWRKEGLKERFVLMVKWRERERSAGE